MKSKILAIILAVAAAASAVAFFMTRGESKEETPQTQTAAQVFSLAGSEYTAKIKTAGSQGEIFMPTDKDNLYYTATLKNEIEFYVFNGGAFTKAPYEKKTTKVTLNASDDSIPVTITYIDADGLTVGYGVFTADMSSSVKEYAYAFVKIAKKAAGYGDGYWLLADFDKDNFYRADKVYSEMYNYKTGQSAVSTAVSQNTRLVDKNGTYRQDWTMLTDEFIKNLGSSKYFMSSRYYTQEETGERTDIMVYSTAYRPTVAAKDIIGYWFVSNSDGMHYLKKDGTGFCSITKKDGKEKKTVEFDEPYSDFLRSGSYIVNKKTNEMTNLLTGEKTTLSGIDITEADIFSLNADATRAVFASTCDPEGKQTQSVIYYSFDTDYVTQSFSEPMLFEESAGFVFLEDGNSVMSVRALSEDGSETGSVIYTFSQKSA